MHLFVIFDVPHTYYLPQYIPVIEQLKSQGAKCGAMLYRDNDNQLKDQVTRPLGIETYWAEGEEQAADIYRKQAPNWIIFGNDFKYLKSIPPSTRTALVYHGSGTGAKASSLAPGLAEFDVRFVSGSGRMKIFSEHFPKVQLHEVGFAKLDPLRHPENIKNICLDLTKLGLDSDKKTILYAPTFYPSSIENMPANFPLDFSEYNILIKAHDFTLHKKKYSHQLKALENWSCASNVYLAAEDEFSLVPFMATADIMISDTSSAIFEFTSLDKPVVICDFPHLRWSYRGIFKYRLKKRLDNSTKHYQQVAEKASTYSELKAMVAKHINEPKLLKNVRMRYAKEIMGNMDGNASKRIYEILLKESKNEQV